MFAPLRVLAVVAIVSCGRNAAEQRPEPTGSGAQAAPSTNATLRGRAEACTVDNDCEYLGDRCGWGCAVTVNKKLARDVEAEIAAHPVKCNIDCPPVGPPICEHGRCRSA